MKRMSLGRDLERYWERKREHGRGTMGERKNKKMSVDVLFS